MDPFQTIQNAVVRLVYVCAVAGRMKDPNAALVHEGINSKQQLHCWRKLEPVIQENETRNSKHEAQTRKQRTRTSPGAQKKNSTVRGNHST